MNRLTYRALDQNNKKTDKVWYNIMMIKPGECILPHTNKEKRVLEKLADYEDAEEHGLIVRLPCKVGGTVYRICPKCNEKHNESCEHCAWRGTGGIGGCAVFGLWEDGQYPSDKCTIVPWVVSWHRMETVIRFLGKRIFLTREEAEAALKGEREDV